MFDASAFLCRLYRCCTDTAVKAVSGTGLMLHVQHAVQLKMMSYTYWINGKDHGIHHKHPVLQIYMHCLHQQDLHIVVHGITVDWSYRLTGDMAVAVQKSRVVSSGTRKPSLQDCCW